MEKFLNLISREMEGAFEAAGYDRELGKVTVSNRPDLCEYQCNGAMAGAKRYHKAPLMIAEDVVSGLQDSKVFSSAEAVRPGFLNLRVREEFLAGYLREMAASDHFGLEMPEKPVNIILDYGGPNVAKPLHVGHLRSAVIGEAVKRIARYHGENVIGDIHLGDWGLQMGLVITELSKRQPDLPYFDPSYEGEYPEAAPFTVAELEEIYPTASRRSKEDPAYYAEAMANTHRLQEGDRGLRALWEKIIEVSVADMKKNYANLNVDVGTIVVQILVFNALDFITIGVRVADGGTEVEFEANTGLDEEVLFRIIAQEHGNLERKHHGIQSHIAQVERVTIPAIFIRVGSTDAIQTEICAIDLELERGFGYHAQTDARDEIVRHSDTDFEGATKQVVTVVGALLGTGCILTADFSGREHAETKAHVKAHIDRSIKERRFLRFRRRLVGIHALVLYVRRAKLFAGRFSGLLVGTFIVNGRSRSGFGTAVTFITVAVTIIIIILCKRHCADKAHRGEKHEHFFHLCFLLDWLNFF